MDPIQKLSPREREVLSLIAQGLANKEIARDLTIANGTVKTHVRDILQKLDVPNRAGAAAPWAEERRDPPDDVGRSR